MILATSISEQYGAPKERKKWLNRLQNFCAGNNIKWEENISVTYVTLVSWWRERRGFTWKPQSSLYDIISIYRDKSFPQRSRERVPGNQRMGI